MKKAFKRILATIMTVVMILTAIPLTGINISSIFVSKASAKEHEVISIRNQVVTDLGSHNKIKDSSSMSESVTSNIPVFRLSKAYETSSSVRMTVDLVSGEFQNGTFKVASNLNCSGIGLSEFSNDIYNYINKNAGVVRYAANPSTQMLSIASTEVLNACGSYFYFDFIKNSSSSVSLSDFTLYVYDIESIVISDTHTHSYTSRITTSPTCTANGVRTYTCSCGDRYTEVITKLGHSFGAWQTTVQPTTTTTGTEIRYCSRCSAYETRTLDKFSKIALEIQENLDINYKAKSNIMTLISDPTNIKADVNYKSSNPNVVMVDNNGNVYGAKKGSATITCTVTDKYGNSVSDTCQVTVSYAWWQWIVKIVLFGFIWY